MKVIAIILSKEKRRRVLGGNASPAPNLQPAPTGKVQKKVPAPIEN